MGIRPQIKKSALLAPSLGIAKTGCDGAMLKRGANFVGKIKHYLICANRVKSDNTHGLLVSDFL